MVNLDAVRAGAKTVLEAAGLNALDYVAERINPPVVLVVPGDPYMTREGAPFGHVLVNLNVLVIGPKGTAHAEAEALDDLIVRTFSALEDEYDLTEVTPPGQVTLGGHTYLGAAITVQSTERME